MTPPQPDSKEHDELQLARVSVCLNCGAPAPGKFCPECGQETAREPRTVAQFFHGLIAQNLARKGRLWQTLSKLFFAPGALTLDYIAGRRARYLRPLQLYLMVSVIVFAAVQLFGLNLGLRLYGEQGVHVLRSSQLSADADHGHVLQLTSMQMILDHFDSPGVRTQGAIRVIPRSISRAALRIDSWTVLPQPSATLRRASGIRLALPILSAPGPADRGKAAGYPRRRAVLLGDRIFRHSAKARLRRHLG